MSESQFSSAILSHYENLLKALSLYVDENGQVYSKKRGGDVKIPTVIENRRLTLPTEAMLALPDWDNVIFFHPFSESVIRGESEMVSWIKDRMVYRITATLSIMITKLTEYAALGNLQTKLTTDQLNTLTTFGDADEKTIENIGSVMEAITRGKGQLFHLYLRHSGKGGDKSEKGYRRFAKVTFPLYRALVEEESNKIFGVQLRIKDRKFLKNVMEYIFDKIAVEDGYSFGSNSEVAPYYHALINAYAKVGIPVSSRIYLFRGPLKEITDTRIHTEGWLDTFEEAAKGMGYMRALPYNIGKDGHGVEGGDTNTDLSNMGKIIEEKPIDVKVNEVLANNTGAANAFQQMISGNSQGNLNSLINNRPAASPIFGNTPTVPAFGQSNVTLPGVPPRANPIAPSTIAGSTMGKQVIGNPGNGFQSALANQGGGFASPFSGLPRR